MLRILLSISILLCVGAQSCEKPWEQGVLVERVIDGDTLIVKYKGEKQRIRLLGINTPEVENPQKNLPSQCYGPEAREYLINLVQGKRVLLKGDPKANFKDKFGRILAWVYLDRELVNFDIIRTGHGFAMTNFPNSHYEKILSLELEAKSTQIGVWSRCPVQCNGKYCEVKH